MKPISLRTRLTLYYSAILAVALAGFGLLFYHSLSLLVDRSLNAELEDHATALRGYLRYQDGQLLLSTPKMPKRPTSCTTRPAITRPLT